MQYELTLPADYDMGIIRRRVADRGASTDDFAGLGLKAYLVRERAKGSAVNQYAPCYLWHDIGAMSRFLVGGGGFHNIVRDFGRPRVRHWTGIALFRGRGEIPRSASRELTELPEDTDAAVDEAVDEAVTELREKAHSGAVHTAALAFDPRTWQLMRFVLWTDTAPGRYEVLHTSMPSLRDIPQGRHW